MQAVLMDGARLKITLTRQELESLSVEIGSVNCRDPDTRRLLARLLEIGKARTGFAPQGARLLVEVYESEAEGGIFCFTVLSGAAAPGSGASPRPVVFAFPDALSLCRCAAGVASRCVHRVHRSSLYRYRGAYRLIVYPLDYSDRLAECFLSEYGQPVGEGHILAAHIREHGRELIRDCALERLEAAHSRSPDSAEP